MGGNTSSPKPPDPNVYLGGFEYIAEQNRIESVAVFTCELFALSTPCGQEIRKRFGGVKWLANQGISSGHVLPIKYNGRYVYYIIVRKNSYSDALLADLQSALVELTTHANTHNVPKVIFENVPPQGIQRTDFEEAITTSMNPRPWDFYNKI
jgi:hypothetical protein